MTTAPATERHLIVVDTETTGLDPHYAKVLEVAAVNVTTGEQLEFVPYFNRDHLITAQPEALAVNRYYERRLFEHELDVKETTEQAEKLYGMLTGNTLAGANPHFDARVLRSFFRSWLPIGDDQTEPWHYRLADLSAYTAGALGLPPTETPGLHRCCELLGVTNTRPHSALGDALAAADCFTVLATAERERQALAEAIRAHGADASEQAS
ncbi:exonuclease domain-containing protein [Rhodococcus pyridinivorans]|uniref:3'-5' exonuclease n=1 Tax=Rhodococcus pyridinivorans TaxID=103816 RepID=UPI000BA263B2|nr:exonuclease domain-containing protein [Rhodococcus pyridinivorans]